MTYPDLNSRPAPDRFIRRWLVITGCIAALMLLWQFLPAIEAWFSPREAAERTVTPRGDLAADEQTTIQLFEKSRGSVVYITTAQLVRDVWSRNVFSVPRGTGSGFIWDDAGHVVTNFHVIQGASSATVKLADGRDYQAALVGASPEHDIAVLKIGVGFKRPPAVPVGTSADLKVGQKVFAIGNPFGLDWTLTTGIVSALDRTLDGEGGGPAIDHLIQTDAAINPGNSGGPLLNSYGEVIGIVSAKYSSYASESVEGLGFAIPINDVVAMIEDIMTNGYVTNKPYLAITGGTMTSQMAAQYRYDVDSGVFVYSVEEGGAADKAGLKMGDVIIKVDDTDITSMEDLTAVKKQYSAGDTATFTIYREGQETTVEVTWDSVPADQQTNQQEASSSSDQNSQYDGSYNPFEDFFRYFYGGGYSGSSAHEAA